MSVTMEDPKPKWCEMQEKLDQLDREELKRERIKDLFMLLWIGVMCVITALIVMLSVSPVRGAQPPIAPPVMKTQPPIAPPMSSFDPYGYTDYRAFHAAVKVTGRGVLVVGVPNRWVQSYVLHCRVPSGFEGLADGEWDYYMQDGRMWRVQRVEVAAPQRPFSGTEAVQVSPSTNTTTARPVVSSPLLVGQRGYHAGTSGGTTYMLVPGAVSSGNTNCVSGFG